MSLTLLPAVDVAGGQSVRLVRGEAGSGTSYGDPLEAARNWQNDGADWVHLVDLDLAFGRGDNAPLLADVITQLHAKVELSGGIQNQATLDSALRTSCARINLSTAALGDRQWCEKVIAQHGDRIAVALDVKGTTLAPRGGTSIGGELFETLKWLDDAGCARYILTDVDRDGALTGPNVELLRRVCEATDRPIIASGGVATLDDLRTLAQLHTLGVEGAIVGKALYAGAFTLPEALRAVND
ncbi:MAG: bifunctional 1-(5-phosphoribosyl)-5-((5-phosphoribosylamino)methylideneamino)imidazole-4-carboxamide isomerase/phosphoribosylanthranilate isomerase PriA [Corynebacteriales bacterium]|nr:bifunctional 1-(5-phosphoribosyl)-5-((5-phosphoribosylamino)methylideneamino)imidazole-4-carboxamide isomerase/phosphoribosylanthranilate isomerase PriA [Mycobacteriales bacterium]